MTADARAPRLPSAIERLAAAGPFPLAEQELMLFGRLVGAWDVGWVALAPAGDVLAWRQGEWHFAWVLGGRGIQDVIWVVGEPPENDGTTLRCWDEDLGAWRAVFMSPGDGEYVTLLARPEGDTIVQGGRHDRPGRRRALRRGTPGGGARALDVLRDHRDGVPVAGRDVARRRADVDGHARDPGAPTGVVTGRGVR